MGALRHPWPRESVAVIDVVPQNTSVAAYGYSTCDQFLRFNPAYCGCWLQRGDLLGAAAATRVSCLFANSFSLLKMSDWLYQYPTGTNFELFSWCEGACDFWGSCWG